MHANTVKSVSEAEFRKKRLLVHRKFWKLKWLLVHKQAAEKPACNTLNYMMNLDIVDMCMKLHILYLPLIIFYHHIRLRATIIINHRRR